ncbi:hypothetical protein SDC9_101265 [bioreactor metagenome]|uniref:Uncharacterized protein n=1 Tax=bioreactor metagenome TaxID=1076179 RepID=A0A645AN67_9ZZZZ
MYMAPAFESKMVNSWLINTTAAMMGKAKKVSVMRMMRLCINPPLTALSVPTRTPMSMAKRAMESPKIRAERDPQITAW